MKFQSPHDGKEMLLTPEKSMEIQNSIGADIMMQLDDVVSSTTTGPRVEEAMYRSIRWLDRCIKAHIRTKEQNLFAIIQGGLDPELRKICVKGSPFVQVYNVMSYSLLYKTFHLIFSMSFTIPNICIM